MFDPNIRKKVIAELERKHELVYLSWKLGGEIRQSVRRASFR